MDFLAAHNASFDQSVLIACCDRARIRPPRHQFRCTVALARSVWSIYPTTLPDVCRRLGITLQPSRSIVRCRGLREDCHRVKTGGGLR